MPPVDRQGRRPADRRWRATLRALHRWFGLASALWLTLLALTGSAIVFYDELDRWLNPDLHMVPAAPAGAAPVASVLHRAAHDVPGFMPRFIDLPDRSGETIRMAGSLQLPEGDTGPAEVFADPRDGSVLGWRLTETISLDRRHLMNFLYGLHMDLILGPAMAWFLGLVALLWVLDHGVAAVLAFPALAKWAASFRVGGRFPGLRWMFDLHRAAGLWLFPVTLVLAVTSLTLTWHEETRAAVRLIAPVSERLHEDFPDRPVETPALDIDAALTVAAVRTGAAADSVLLLPRKGAYGVRSFDARDMDGYGRLWTYVSMEGGQVLGQRHDLGEGAGDMFFAWQYPLHSGKGLGLAGRLLVLAGGLSTAMLCLTGLWLWWKRRR
ncbi:PepSY-associated TM helix domain-containing protein [Indioceanicola profundi]|uniref:PepSY-associated TM helix domain-containing protein n=1 Tax=Indioceanicola profundi TaxID=2220096 RepID=UPI001CEC01AB|nr:PepSY-associated TM helix domain-containing protein [Indioceanicola profundi]